MSAVQPPLMRGDDVGYVPVPLFHIFGLNVGLGMTLHAGATAVLAGRFDPGDTLATMAEAQGDRRHRGARNVHRVAVPIPTFTAGSRRFGSHCPDRPRSRPRSSTAMPRRVLSSSRDTASTECAPAVTLNAGDAKPGSIGRPLPGVEVELRDPDGEPITDDDPGQLIVRGPNLFSGYWPDGARRAGRRRLVRHR